MIGYFLLDSKLLLSATDCTYDNILFTNRDHGNLAMSLSIYYLEKRPWRGKDEEMRVNVVRGKGSRWVWCGGRLKPGG